MKFFTVHLFSLYNHLLNFYSKLSRVSWQERKKWVALKKCFYFFIFMDKIRQDGKPSLMSPLLLLSLQMIYAFQVHSKNWLHLSVHHMKANPHELHCWSATNTWKQLNGLWVFWQSNWVLLNFQIYGIKFYQLARDMCAFWIFVNKNAFIYVYFSILQRRTEIYFSTWGD